MIKTIAKATMAITLLLAPMIQKEQYEYAKEYSPIIEVEAVGISENIAIEKNGDLIYSENDITYKKENQYIYIIFPNKMIKILGQTDKVIKIKIKKATKYVAYHG